MADLPKYQQTGRTFADLPQFDFTNVREAFKASQSLTSALDRVTDFANKSAAKQAEAKAERFSIDNPLTLEQIQEAAKSGITPEDLVAASGGGQIWQDTVKKLQGEQLRTQLEVLGKQALLDLQTQVDTNQITNMNDVRAKQEAIVNGLRKTLSFSPDAVVRFDSTMGTVASSLYKEAQNKLVKDYKLSQQSLGIQNLDNSVRAYQAMLGNSEITDPTMLRDIESALADQLERQSAEGGADFALKQKEDFVKRIGEEKINYFTKIAANPEYATDIATAAKKMRSGDFGGGTQLYANLPEEDKKKIKDAALSEWGRVISASKQQEDFKKIENKQVDDADLIAFSKLPDNSKQKKIMAQELFKRDLITWSTMDSVVNPKAVGEGNVLDETHADRDISEGRITNEKQLKALYPNLTTKQVDRLIRTMTDTNIRNVKADLRIAAGASAEPMAPIDVPAAKRIQDINYIYNKYRDEKNPDGTFKYSITEAKDLAVQEYPKSEKVKTAKTAQKQSAESIKANFKDFNPDTMTVDGYAKKKKLDEAIKLKLQRQHQTYINNKNVTGLSNEAL